jgi:hypothetical protein
MTQGVDLQHPRVNSLATGKGSVLSIVNKTQKHARMETTSEGWPNEASAMDGGSPALFQIARPWSAASDPQCWPADWRGKKTEKISREKAQDAQNWAVIFCEAIAAFLAKITRFSTADERQ